MVLKSKESIVALAATLVLHLILLLLFLLIKVHWNPKLQSFTEISFLSGTNSTAFAANEHLTAPPTASETKDQSEETVRLPQRKMLEQESLTVPVKKQKMTPHDKPAIPEQGKIYPPQMRSSELAALPLPEKEIPALDEKFSLDDKAIPSTGPVSLPGEKSPTPYTIEGEAAHRSVVYKILPRYPEGLQKTATVRVQFTVLPDGQIGEMIPLIKSDAELERLTINALKQWRFNPLPANQPQQAEIGIITFRYLLK